ncbi:MAG: cytochrome c [Halothiobacillaceae bacterium]
MRQGTGTRGQTTALAIVMVMGLGSGLVHSPAHAEENATPQRFLEIMNALGEDMVEITRGITSEDWMQVAEHAEAIANHPRPPMSERARILAFAGSDMATFRQFDQETHQAAEALADEAAGGDGEAIIAGFSRLQNGCLSCHAQFRSAYRDHFQAK